jgi:hypothetical protein
VLPTWLALQMLLWLQAPAAPGNHLVCGWVGELGGGAVTLSAPTWQLLYHGRCSSLLRAPAQNEGPAFLQWVMVHQLYRL